MDDTTETSSRRSVPAPPACAAGVPTVGVEEELFLVCPGTGAVVGAGPRVAALAARELGDLVAGEFTDLQVEVRTPPCTDTGELHAHLVRARQAVAAAAAGEGLRVCPSATPVIGGSHAPVGDHPRYRAGVELYRSLMDDFVVSALHVHVLLPDREVAALVGNHLRPWLPLLVEMTANSPYFDGRDTGYASWRTVTRLRIPALGPPPYIESFDDYRRTTAQLAAARVVPFADLPFWDVRPHPRLPTIEVRSMDVPPDPADSAAVAAVVRALVDTSARLVEGGDPGPRLSSDLLRGAYWYSTRDGWTGTGLDALSAAMLPAPERARRLMDHIGPALQRFGDLDRAAAFFDRLAAHGTGAHRQRAAHRAGGLPHVVADLTANCAAPHRE
ncbi:YbdK family carboxylate-amine ligase [Kitasatospora sp. NPDC101157]|uniref:carboxylate-amine ligase n=1 Tax=Kitasatospora sp. NPDC101157 TaxID=3364098 RepID=UPI00381D0C78